MAGQCVYEHFTLHIYSVWVQMRWPMAEGQWQRICSMEHQFAAALAYERVPETSDAVVAMEEHERA